MKCIGLVAATAACLSLAGWANVPAIAQAGSVAVAREGAAAALPKILVDDVAQLMRANYVRPDQTERVIAALQAKRESGSYEGLDPNRLAEAVTEHLQQLTNDKHMYVNYAPDQAAAQRAAAGGAPNMDFLTQVARETNQGIVELRVLPNNIRYMKLSAFHAVPQRTEAAYDAAMDFMRDGAAYIIDISGTGGGSPFSVAYLASYLMEPGRLLMDYRIGPAGAQQSHTRRTAGERLPDRPLFLITGPGSASAAEEFAAHVKNFRLGTLVGQTTAGAGNRNSVFATEEGFMISVSVGTATHPVTGTGWEGTGVAPDLHVPLDRALLVARRAALLQLAEGAEEKEAATYRWAADALAAEIEPVALSDADLRALAGSYGQDRRVEVRGDRLIWHFGRNSWPMLPLTTRLFALEGTAMRLRFADESGRVSAVQEIAATGQRSPVARSSS